MLKPYSHLRAQMSPAAQAAVQAAVQDAQALADRVWARQAPSTRWLEVQRGDTAPPQAEDDT